MSEKDSSYHGKITEMEDLVKIKDPRLYRDVKQAISRFHSVLGVRTKDVMLAKLDKDVYGIGDHEGVFLNSVYFNQPRSEFEKLSKKDEESGWHTKTNKPVAHTVTHELAHALWNSGLNTPNARAAEKAVTKLYGQWLKDKSKKGYGKYAARNRDEFWAETCTKAVHGTQDKYTKAVKNIAKKYKL